MNDRWRRLILSRASDFENASGALFSQGIGDPSPDLVLDLGRGRTGNDGGGAGSLPAGLDQAQSPPLAIGEIEIAAAVAAGERRSDAGHLVFGLDHAGAFQVARELLSLGVDIGIDVMGDGAGIVADADASIEGRIAEPDRPLFLALIQHLPEPDMMAALGAVAIGLFERQILVATEIMKAADGCSTVG